MGDLLGSPRERVSYLAYPNLFGTKGLEEEEEDSAEIADFEGCRYLS